MLLLEYIYKVLDKGVIKVLSTQVSIALWSFNTKFSFFIDAQDGYIERAATHIKDKDSLIIQVTCYLFFVTVS